MQTLFSTITSRFTLAALVASTFAFVTARPAGAVMYMGTPDLSLTSAMVDAGGGAKHFSSAELFAWLTGDLKDKEAAKLTAQFGAHDVAEAFQIFDFAVNDTLLIATREKIALPPANPPASDRKAFAIALYNAGTTPSGKWDVGYFLEHLITHPIHHEIMHDMDARFGQQENATFHMILEQMMHDVGVAYGPALPPTVDPAAK
jgi:hypothetical protein